MALVISGLSLSWEASAQDKSQASDAEHQLPYALLDTFGEVFSKVRSSYVTEKSDEELIKAAIRGMLLSLDPHSDFLERNQLNQFQTQTRGEFGGLGIEVTMESGFVKIIAPRDDTPASRAGLLPGDLITHIDGVSVQGMSLGEAVSKMRGPLGEAINITILRSGKDPFKVDIIRDRIVLHSVRWRREGDIGYIRIASFSENTFSELTNAIEKLKAGGLDSSNKSKDADLPAPISYVLDLRSNPGGLLDQAVKVSDSFLERGEIVSTRGRDPRSAKRYQAKPGDLVEGLPLVVLIDSGSASASEIVAGALKDHGRALLVGTRSFGKGSVQTVFPLSTRKDALMKLTVQLYYTPSGDSIQALGIEPDIKVERATIEEITSSALPRGESTLLGAIAAQEQGETDEDEAQPENLRSYTEAVKEDYQLLRALDLARAMSIFKS